MNLNLAYIKINRRLKSEYLEPSWGWGLRVGISVTIPLAWGMLSGRGLEAEWMAIAAECVSFIDLKGTIGQRVRILLSAFLLSLIFAIVGSLAGNFLWLSLLGMLIVGFLCGLFKNLGDRGLGLALSIYIFYIVTSSYPIDTWHALGERALWVGLGGFWTVIVGVCSFIFIKAGSPYRRSIAQVWESVAQLAARSGSGWDGRSKKSSVREIYLKEMAVRNAINQSIDLFEETSDMVPAHEKEKYAMVQSRKCASLVSLQIIQISEIVESFANHTYDRRFSIRIFSLFRSLQQIGERMNVYLMTLRKGEQVLLLSRLERLEKISGLLAGNSELSPPGIEAELQKINTLCTRIDKLVRRSVALLAQRDEPRVFHTYSFAHTLNILHPKYLRTNVRQLMNFNSLTTRYALRIGISTMIGLLVAALFFPDHGYWIPFTAIIVAQPYFGATMKKGLQRSVGTITGVVVGTGFLQLPFPDIARLILIFVSSVLLIYYLRRNYGIAAFFITLMLVGLLSFEPHFSYELLLLRISGTLIGSALAIIAGFLLLPSWDKILLPRYFTEAFVANTEYFQNTFYHNKNLPWTRLKRHAETKNNNAFESLTRSLREPGSKKKIDENIYYFLLTHNIRITRELNNFNSESEMDDQKIPIREKETYIQLLYACDDLFRDILQLMRQEGNDFVPEHYMKSFPEEGFSAATPTEAQLIYLEKLLLELKFIRSEWQKSDQNSGSAVM